MNTNKMIFSQNDKCFFNSFFRLFAVICLQNVITFSLNVSDSIMLGMFSQTALAAATAVNQIQFVLQLVVLNGLGEGLVVQASQYWGNNDHKTIYKLTGLTLTTGACLGLIITIWTVAAPRSLLALFTNDPIVQKQGIAYLSYMRYTFLPFIFTNLILMSLRSMQIVKIAFRLSCIALCINIALNYVFIFGHFGLSAMGAAGSALSTLIAIICELCILLIYCRFGKLEIRFSLSEMFSSWGGLGKQYLKITIPCTISAVLFGSAVAMQTAILGHLSTDALAANSAASTMFQYLKMIPSSAASASCVLIGQAVGAHDENTLHHKVNLLQVIYVCLGLLTCFILLLLGGPVLSLYSLTPMARHYAGSILIIMAITSIGTAYEMPCQLGIIRGGGDTRYVAISDFIYSWCVVVPLSLIAAFICNLSVPAVVICLNCDQVIKCLTVGIKTNRYTWIRHLTKFA